MMNRRLPVIVRGKRVTHLQNKTILRGCEVRSQCVSRSAEITQAISFALVSASHSLANFSGFTGFLTITNDQNLTRL